MPVNASTLEPFSRERSRGFVLASRLFSAVLTVVAFLISFYPLLGRQSWMDYLEDDFFYYLKVAVNLAHGHGSTFNGLVPTNGYHPLWLACVTLAAAVSTGPLWIMAFLSIANFAATIITFLLGRRLLEPSAGPLAATALAAYVALYSQHLFNHGMEVILTIPLLLAVLTVYLGRRLWQPRLLPAFSFGILLSCLFLSRLDSGILVALLLLATVAHPALRARLRTVQVAGVAAGLLPSVAYLLSNRLLFHTLLPISGMAKQLRFHHFPASQPWTSLFHKAPTQLVNVIPILIALAVLPFVIRSLTPTRQVLFPVLLLFPFLYLTVLSFVSDWKLWDWYFWSLRVALLIAFAVLLAAPPVQRLLRAPSATIALALVCFALMLTNRRQTSGTDMRDIAQDLANFAQTHPGVYAMGDRSGVVGYLLPDPLVQTEGLVMDKGFLDLVRAGTPLDRALARYHVRYYVATAVTAPPPGCFHAVEPFQAGPDSAHMTTDLCQPPVARFIQRDYQTLIFDLQQPQP